MDSEKMTDGFIVYYLDDLEGGFYHMVHHKRSFKNNDMVIRIERMDKDRVIVEVGEWSASYHSCVLLNDQLANMAVQIIGYLTGNSFRQDPK